MFPNGSLGTWRRQDERVVDDSPPSLLPIVVGRCLLGTGPRNPQTNLMTNGDVSPNRVQLDRVLGPWMATALVVGTVIGSGVFKKPHAVAQAVPTFGWAIAAWVLLGVLVMCGGLAAH